MAYTNQRERRSIKINYQWEISFPTTTPASHGKSMTASSTMVLIFIFQDLILPPALLERKRKQRKDWDAGVLWGATASFTLLSLFENDISTCASRAVESCLNVSKLPVYWLAKWFLTGKLGQETVFTSLDVRKSLSVVRIVKQMKCA